MRACLNFSTTWASHGKVLGAIRNPIRLTAVFFFCASGEEEARDLVEVSIAG